MTAGKIALFDFDGTICPGDSIVPYLLWCIRAKKAPFRQLFRAARGYLKARRHPEDVSLGKAMTLSFIRGRAVSEMDSLGREFWQARLLPKCYPEAIRTMREMRDAGATVAVVSASPEVYMRLAADFLPADAVLSTPCLTRGGIYTGDVGPNCRDEEKLRRVERWLAEQGRTLQDAETTVWGDSAHDVPLLRAADHAVLVGPDRRLSGAVPGAQTVRWGGK